MGGLKNFGVTSSFVVVVRVLVAFAATASRLPLGLFWPDEFHVSNSFLEISSETLWLSATSIVFYVSIGKSFYDWIPISFVFPNQRDL